jgi:hypothetical protein
MYFFGNMLNFEGETVYLPKLRSLESSVNGADAFNP